ncbi:MAG: flagellar basal body P-ring formation protein FlgA [Rhodocyclaceae bacterium]|nr:flagellar basal body P-ring formation protein FlgA [Rhodocyclaceae bacterium]
MNTPSAALAHRFSRSAAALLLTVLAHPALAAYQAPQPVQEAAHALLVQETNGLPGEVRITVFPPDPAKRQPACAALEAFLPSGTRAWGRTSVGVRCNAPTPWVLYLKATVEVLAEYPVSARALASGTVIRGSDLTMQRGDITQLPADALLDTEEIIGQQTRHLTGVGKPLRKSLLVTPEVIRAGQRVSVLIQERTFTVSTEGKAIHRAGAGERVRVLLDNRRTVNGIAQPDGSVVVEL